MQTKEYDAKLMRGTKHHGATPLLELHLIHLMIKNEHAAVE